MSRPQIWPPCLQMHSAIVQQCNLGVATCGLSQFNALRCRICVRIQDPLLGRRRKSGHRPQSTVKAIRQGTEGYLSQLLSESTHYALISNSTSPPLDVLRVLVVVVVGSSGMHKANEGGKFTFSKYPLKLKHGTQLLQWISSSHDHIGRFVIGYRYKKTPHALLMLQVSSTEPSAESRPLTYWPACSKNTCFGVS